MAAQSLARKYQKALFSSVCFLARQVLAFRCYDHRDGTFWQLLKLRKQDISELDNWLLQRDNWTSFVIQNEIIELCAHDIQKKIITLASSSNYYGIISDRTTDIVKKQLDYYYKNILDLSSIDHKLLFSLIFGTVRDSYVSQTSK